MACFYFYDRGGPCPANCEQPVSGRVVADHVCWVFTAYARQLLCSVALQHSFVWHHAGLQLGQVSPPLLFSFTGEYGVTWAAWSSYPFWARPQLIWSVASFLWRSSAATVSQWNDLHYRCLASNCTCPLNLSEISLPLRSFGVTWGKCYRFCSEYCCHNRKKKKNISIHLSLRLFLSS